MSTQLAVAAALASGIPLGPGSTIHALCGTGAVVNLMIFGSLFDSDGNVEAGLLAKVVVGTANAIAYTVPAGKTVVISQIVFANTSGTDVTGTKLGINGTAATAANQILSALTVPLNGTVIFAGNQLRAQTAPGTLV